MKYNTSEGSRLKNCFFLPKQICNRLHAADAKETSSLHTLIYEKMGFLDTNYGNIIYWSLKRIILQKNVQKVRRCHFVPCSYNII